MSEPHPSNSSRAESSAAKPASGARRRVWTSDDPAIPLCYLTEETEEAAGTVSTPSGEILFLNVSGTSEEMGYEFGRRLASEIHRGPLPFFATFMHQTLKQSPLGKVADFVGWAMHEWVTDRLAENLPDEFMRAAEAMAEGADLQRDTMLKAYLMPETFLWLIGTYHRLTGAGPAPALPRPPICGCTSAILTPPAAETPLHARNFDYFGIDSWDRNATVTFYHPDNGLDYVSATSAGILGGGLTAMNDAGLTFTVHQHFLSEFDLDGVPVGVAGDRVMRETTCIEEAVEVLRAHPPVGGWSYIMTEGDTGRAAVYEVAPGREALHWLDEEAHHLSYSNVYWDSDLQESEIDYYPEYSRTNLARQRRSLSCASELAHAPEPARASDVADILADFTDPETGERRLVGRTIAAAHTVTSVVFEPAERRIWVGSGRSPTSLSWFVPFNLHGDQHAGRGGPDLDAMPFHPDPGWDRTAHGQAYSLYRKACRGFREGEDDNRLLIRIEHALALYPHEPNLHVLAGLLAMRVGRARRAEGAFRRAVEQVSDPARLAELNLFWAWSLDLQNRRSEARELYQSVLRNSSADSRIQRRARLNRWIRFGPRQAANLTLDFLYVGVTG